nr:MAG TPA: hypothetical protein [Caudoviricetes sp.]
MKTLSKGLKTGGNCAIIKNKLLYYFTRSKAHE